MKTKSGNLKPFGLSFVDDQVNFSLYAPHAESCDICIYDEKGHHVDTICLNRQTHFHDGIWHVSCEAKPLENHQYLFCLDGTKFVLDPYAKFLNTDTVWGSGAKMIETKGIIKKVPLFDWEHVASPNYQFQELIIYEMHTRSFTIKADVKYPGTFLGIIEKIPHFKNLGINAIELMPIHEFNECENPKPGLYNYWGYSPIAYFAFMQRYAAKQGHVLNEFKSLVKELHKHEIAIIIDVVYNHTAEGGPHGPHYHFKDLDPHYYLKDTNGHYIDYSGCGNTIDANRNPGLDLVLDSLRYLADDCHVDGFRFDLASTFYRQNHHVLKHPPIIDSILKDPILSKKLLIAEAWDASGLYQVGRFPKPFGDWNGAYRDKVRAFLNHQHHSKGPFADAITGTSSLFFDKGPQYSINFITAHDGFTLHDLFSYNHKHNAANLENDADGNNHNISHNWGHEGNTDNPHILDTRSRLQNLALACLFLSLGPPMLYMGDEYGHTRNGNNNPYCQDNELNYFLWDKLDNQKIKFIHKLTQIRKKIKRLVENRFFDKDELIWHGLAFHNPAWNRDDYFICMELKNKYLIIINASSHKKIFLIPSGSWIEIFSSLEQKKDSEKIDNTHYMIEAHTLTVLQAQA